MVILSTKKLKASLIIEAQALGLRVLGFNFIEIKHLYSPFQANSITNAQQHIIFTSANAVEAYQKNIDRYALQIPHKKLYCLQGETFNAATRLQNVEIMGRAENARELAQVIIEQQDTKRASFFCGNKRSDALPGLLRQQNIVVDETVLYHTNFVHHQIKEAYKGVLFFSPSAVESFFQSNFLPEYIPCFCIGDTTKNALRQYVDNEAIVAETCSQEGVMQALYKKFYAMAQRPYAQV